RIYFSAARLAQRPFHVAPALALPQGLALVVDVLAAGQRDLDLGVRAREVDARGDEREPALRGTRGDAVELAPVQQQLARALGLGRFEVHAPARGIDPQHAHRDAIAQPQRGAASLRAQHRAELVQLPPVCRAPAARSRLRARAWI